MLALVGSNMTDSRKDIGTMSCASLDTVTMINTTLTSLVINIKVSEVVVKVNRASTQVTAQKSSVRGKDGSNVNLALLDQWNGNTSQPFVEMSNNSWTWVRFG